jgi:predicted O-methyltransferase YrrM
MHHWARRRIKHGIVKFYKLGVRAGVFVIPVHYYAAEPDIIELAARQEEWAGPSSLPGLEIDLDQQAATLECVCGPFTSEYGDAAAAFTEATRSGIGLGYGYIEAQALHGVVRHFRPRKIVEVGSGVSTVCAARAIERNAAEGYSCALTCIEPHPSAQLLGMVARTRGMSIRASRVQSVGVDAFTELEKNDILFVDSSHVVRVGGDVNYLVLEVLPLLEPGVLVHVHDIFLPYDYQPDVLDTFFHWNETSLVRAFLAFNDRYRILFCMSHLHHSRRTALEATFPDYRPALLERGLATKAGSSGRHFPSSLWLQVADA